MKMSMEAPISLEKYRGQIRVGRIVYVNGKPIHPKLEGYKSIVVMTPSSAYGELGPYVLKTEEGYLLENYWHACKVFESIPACTQTYSRFDNTVIWDHIMERHIDTTEDGNLKERPNRYYWRWRKKLCNAPHAVRYPVGESKQVRRSVLYFLKERHGDKMDYITARKKIYFDTYRRSVTKQSKYKKLIDMLERGEKLLIIEVDGPRKERLPYYRENYNVPNNWITDNTIEINQRNMNILVDDVEASFGHGYCLAMTLMALTFT